jgi:peptide/nickel transport system substrate-binding protein
VIQGNALPWPDGSVGAKTSDPAWLDYNPDKAKQLIQQAGATGASFSIAITPTGGQDTLAQFVQDDLKQVGLDVTLEKLEYAAFLDQLRGKKFTASAWVAVAGFAQTIDPATMVSVAQLYPTPNPSHFQPAAYTDLLKQIPTADPNTPEGLSVFKQFNEMAFRDDPWVPPLAGRPDFHAMTSKVHGDTGNVNGRTAPAKDWWIA